MEDLELIENFCNELRRLNSSEYTVLNYKKDIESFLEFIKSEKFAKDLPSVKRVRICQYYISNLSNQGDKPRTINRHLSALRTFYSYLQKEELTDSNPFLEIKNIKMEKRLPKFIDNQDIITLINNIDTETKLGFRNRLIIELLFATGMRVSELCSLEVNQIDFYNNEIKVFGKGKKERIVFLYDSLAQDLNHYVFYTRLEFLAVSRQFDIKNVFINYKGTPLTTRGVRKILDSEIDKTANLSHMSPHMLRHSFATSMLDNGLDLRSVQTLLGHENLSTTQIYTHVSSQALKETFDKSFPRSKTKENK